MSKLEGSITITRPNYSDGTGLIRIAVKDALSLSRFIEVEIGLKEFAEALTGLSEVAVSFEVRNLDIVGLRRFRETRFIDCPLRVYDKAVLEQWLIENAAEEGWTIDPYLGSQGSVSYNEDGTRKLRYSVFCFLPEGETP
jgi:hypothetical protein